MLDVNIHFVVLCETNDFWWLKSNLIPRIGETVYNDNVGYKILDVAYDSRELITITVDRLLA